MKKSSDLQKCADERNKHDAQFVEEYEEEIRRLRRAGVNNKFTTEVNVFIEKYRSALKRLAKK